MLLRTGFALLVHLGVLVHCVVSAPRIGDSSTPNSIRTTVAGSDSTFEVRIQSPPAGYSQAIVRAAEILGSSWVSLVPVVVDVQFRNLDAGVLASASASSFVRRSDILYTVAAAEAINNQAINDPNTADITVSVNQNYPSFHLDPQTSPPTTKIDLVTTILHEIYHGLLFTGRATFAQASGENFGGFDGEVTAFDNILSIGNCTVVGFLNESVTVKSKEVASAFTSKILSIYWNGKSTLLYSPETFLPGSSIYHLSTQASSTAMCMTPAIPAGVAQRSICDDVLSIQQAILSGQGGGTTPCEPGTYNQVYEYVTGQGIEPPGQKPNTPSDTIAGLPKTTFYAIVGVLGGVFVILILGAAVCIPSRRKASLERVVIVNQDGELLSDYVSPRGPSNNTFSSGRFFTPGGPGAPAAPPPAAVFLVDANGNPVSASGRLNFNNSRTSSFNAGARMTSFNSTSGRQPSFAGGAPAARQPSFGQGGPRSPSFSAGPGPQIPVARQPSFGQGPRAPSFNAGPGAQAPAARQPSFGQGGPRAPSFNAGPGSPGQQAPNFSTGARKGSLNHQPGGARAPSFNSGPRQPSFNSPAHSPTSPSSPRSMPNYSPQVATPTSPRGQVARMPSKGAPPAGVPFQKFPSATGPQTPMQRLPSAQGGPRQPGPGPQTPVQRLPSAQGGPRQPGPGPPAGKAGHIPMQRQSSASSAAGPSSPPMKVHPGGGPNQPMARLPSAQGAPGQPKGPGPHVGMQRFPSAQGRGQAPTASSGRLISPAAGRGATRALSPPPGPQGSRASGRMAPPQAGPGGGPGLSRPTSGRLDPAQSPGRTVGNHQGATVRMPVKK